MPNTVEYKNWLFVKVGAHKDAFIDDEVLCIVYNYGGRKGEDYYPDENEEILLPPGSWQIIGKADSLTDTDWEGIVEKDGNFYRLYHRLYWSDGSTPSPTLSGHTLLKSFNLEPGTTLILKKQTP